MKYEIVDHRFFPGSFSVGFRSIEAQKFLLIIFSMNVQVPPSEREREANTLFLFWSQTCTTVRSSVTLPVRLRNPRCPCGINKGVLILLPLACIHFLFLCALLTLDVAAPAHLALARPGQHAALRVVATPTADGVAVLVFVALPRCRPCRVHAGLAEVRRVLDVQQV